MPEAYVFDASALSAYFYGEPGEEVVTGLLRRAVAGELDLHLHVIHVGEVYYTLYRRGGRLRAEEGLEDIKGFSLHRHDRISLEFLREVGRIKATYRLSYANAFAVGLARLQNARLVSCDHRELETLEGRGEVAMLWVR